MWGILEIKYVYRSSSIYCIVAMAICVIAGIEVSFLMRGVCGVIIMGASGSNHHKSWGV